MQRISLCMIIKNEEIFLSSMLRSLRPFVDEIIIVDTGSTDKSVRIANEFADEVIQIENFPGFSISRNIGIDKATGDWILSLDADEFITPEGILKLRRIADSFPIDDGFFISRTHYTGNGRWSKTWGIKFFRRLTSLRYCKAIHESVGEALVEWQYPFGRRLPWVLDVEVHHFEIWKPKSALISKHQQYIKLLEDEINERPNDIHLKSFLALEYYTIEGLDKALKISNEAIELLQKDGGNPTGLPLLFRALFKMKANDLKGSQKDLEEILSDGRSYGFKAAAALADLKYKQGCYEEAIKLLCQGIQHIGRDPALLCNLALCYQAVGDYEQALFLLRETILVWPQIVDQRIYQRPNNESIYSIQEDLFSSFRGVYWHIAECFGALNQKDLEKKCIERANELINCTSPLADFFAYQQVSFSKTSTIFEQELTIN